MALTVEQLIQAIGADINDDFEEVQRTLTQAQLMVQNYVSENVVPQEIVDLAVLRVAQALWNANHVPAQSGNSFYETTEAPAPVNRDPMTTAYVILRKWVLPW